MAEEDEKPEAGEDSEADAKLRAAEKGGRTKLIIGMVLGIVLGGTVAFFGVQQLNQGAPADEPVEEEVVEEEPEPIIEYQVLRIKRLPASLTNDRGETIGYYFLDILLSMTTLDDHTVVAARLPYVQEVINKDIAYNGISMKGRPGTIDYDNLPERLRAAINKYFGQERVKIVTLEKVSPGQ